MLPLWRSHKVALEIAGYVGIDLFCCGDVRVGSRLVTHQLLGHPAAVQTERIFGIHSQRRVVVGKRQVQLLQLRMDKTAGAERAGLAGPEAQRLVAVRHSLLKLVDHRRCEASVDKGGGKIRAVDDAAQFVKQGEAHHDEAGQGQDVHAEQDFLGQRSRLALRHRCYYAQGVLCSPASTRGYGSSSRTSNMPPAVSTFAPMHHRATNALASVASAK